MAEFPITNETQFWLIGRVGSEDRAPNKRGFLYVYTESALAEEQIDRCSISEAEVVGPLCWGEIVDNYSAEFSNATVDEVYRIEDSGWKKHFCPELKRR